MAKKRRPGQTATFSISVDKATQRILKEEAARAYGGNVSALVAAIAKEAKRQAALDWLLEGATISEDERARFVAELDGRGVKKKRRTAAA